MNGIRTVEGECDVGFRQSRRPFSKVKLLTFKNSLTNSLNFLDDFENYILPENYDVGLLVYGLTQNTTTNEYMMVFNRLDSIDPTYGECMDCGYNNISHAWCQTCDTLKETQGWTSGNKDI